MDIRIKETVYVKSGDTEHVIRQGTIGADVKRVVYFPDTTRTVSVGFSRDFCLESPQLFSVSRTLSDSEISLKDVKKLLESTDMDEELRSLLQFKLEEL